MCQRDKRCSYQERWSLYQTFFKQHMRKQLCLSKPYSLKVRKDAADRQKRRQENKFKEMKSQIFVSLVGLMQTYGDNMEKGESFKGELKRHCEAAMQIFQGELLSVWDSTDRACRHELKASRRPWLLVQPKAQMGFSALKEVVGGVRISCASPWPPTRHRGKVPTETLP